MSYSPSTLILRNLRDVFGENDPARRRAAIDEIYNEDCVFYDPNSGAHRGRDEIDRVAGSAAPQKSAILGSLRTADGATTRRRPLGTCALTGPGTRAQPR
jgi:hypothetical protein